MNVDQWTYKGHIITIQRERVDDEADQIWHMVQNPNGNTIVANVDQYDLDRNTVNLWIDLGCPKPRMAANGVMVNWDARTLRGVLTMQRIALDAFCDAQVLSAAWNTLDNSTQEILSN